MRLVLHGLTQREISGAVSAPGLLPVVIGGDLDQIQLPSEIPEIDGYITLALQSGSPMRPSDCGHPPVTPGWMPYLDHVVSRDVPAAGQVRDPVRRSWDAPGRKRLGRVDPPGARVCINLPLVYAFLRENDSAA